MLYVATCLQLCRITSATLVSQEYHKTAQTSRGSEANLQKKYRFFKKSSPFYRNSSVTKSPKTLQLCCASRQNQPSATASAHFRRHSSAFQFAYSSMYIHFFAYRSFVYAFVPLHPIPFSAPFPQKANLEPLCSVRHNNSIIKKHKKRDRCTILCNGLSQFRLCY